MFLRTPLVVLAVVTICGASAGFGESVDSVAVKRQHFLFLFEDTQYVDYAESVLNRSRQQLLAFVGDTLPYKPVVHLVGDADSFNRLLRGRFPDWGAAAAIPERQTIVVKSPDKFDLGKSLNQLLAHEYAHLVVAHRSGFHRPPRWFDEGVAMLVSVEWGWSDNLAMSKAAVFGQFMPLNEIELVNRFSRGKAHVAYAQSYLAVQYLLDSYGKYALRRFLDEYRASGSVDDALLAAAGATYSEFEDEYLEYLNGQYNIVSLFNDMLFFWLGLALVVLVGFFLSFRKRRKYYRKWEQEEVLQSTDFEYGDPDNPERTDDDEPWRG